MGINTIEMYVHVLNLDLMHSIFTYAHIGRHYLIGNVKSTTKIPPSKEYSVC